MNIKNDKWIDAYVDSVKFRVDFVDKDYRDALHNEILHFINGIKLVSIQYDKEKSSEYCQIRKLNSSNTTIATVVKSGYPHKHSNITNYYISIAFHGLRRYNKKIDSKSQLLLKYIVSFLNSKKEMEPVLSQLDICTDVPCPIENLIVVCVNRKSRKKYHQLGDYDECGDKIQKYDGTYEVEKFTRDDDNEKFPTKEDLSREIKRRKSNVKKLAYMYNKRKKELAKANNDIGFELTRVEMKLQRKFLLDNEVSANSFLQELKDYKIFYFEDIKKKEKFIKQYNKANSNKHRNQLISKISETTPTIKTNMNKVGEFIRMIDTIKLDNNGKFTITKKEDYLSGTSKFNRKNNFFKQSI